MRREIVVIVQSFCHNTGLDYRTVWNTIYKEYGKQHNIFPALQYKFGSKSKLDFLEDYEELAGTMTKMYNIVKELE